MRGRELRGAAAIVVLLAAGAILGATILPTSDPVPAHHALCILCGERGTADAILNVALFLPLGAALAFARAPFRRALIMAALFSVVIEATQLLVLRGRNANIGDICFNALGAAAGHGLMSTPTRWLIPDRRRAIALAWGWSAVIGAVNLGAALLLVPDFPGGLYYAEWSSPEHPLDWYYGEVTRATVGTLSVPIGHLTLDDSRRMRAALRAGSRIHVLGLASRPPNHISPLLTISRDDESTRGIVLLGIDRGDVVLRYSTRSERLRLAAPDLHVPGLMGGVEPGDSIVLDVWKEGRAHCFRSRAASRCDIALPIARGWSVLGAWSTLPRWSTGLLDILWIAGMFAPLGFWIRRTPAGLLALLPAGLSLVVAGTVGGLLRPTTGDLAAAIAGAACGAAIGLARRRRDVLDAD